ncbi:unnamed protein product [Pleuronectes platessa]|uniref:Uncharacterized protein n=1 Tax=Pleuronectes platessa TaxID=8262 RepID=A0A9N7V961_PLEPL|nr:unnamed protein product [Pleuronectes platessa]
MLRLVECRPRDLQENSFGPLRTEEGKRKREREGESESERGGERERETRVLPLAPRAQQLSSLSPGWCGYWRVSGIVTGARQHKPRAAGSALCDVEHRSSRRDTFALKSLRDARRRLVRFSYSTRSPSCTLRIVWCLRSHKCAPRDS